MRARLALECLLHATDWPDPRLYLLDAVERAAGTASADQLVDLEQVLLVVSHRRW